MKPVPCHRSFAVFVSGSLFGGLICAALLGGSRQLPAVHGQDNKAENAVDLAALQQEIEVLKGKVPSQSHSMMALKQLHGSETCSLLSVLLTSLVMVSCFPPGSEVAFAAQKPGQSGKASILISSDALAGCLKDPNVRIVGTRSRDKYLEGHVPGAIWVDVNDWKTLSAADGGLHSKKGCASAAGQAGRQVRPAPQRRP